MCYSLLEQLAQLAKERSRLDRKLQDLIVDYEKRSSGDSEKEQTNSLKYKVSLPLA